MPPSNESTSSSLMRFLRDGVILFLGTLLAAWLVPEITYVNKITLVWVALVLAFFNAILKPLLILFALPFVVLTLGLGIWLINAVLLYLAGSLVSGFAVPTFGAALWGALVISLTGVVSNLVFPPRKGKGNWNVEVSRSGSPRSGGPRPRSTRKREDDDVIDV